MMKAAELLLAADETYVEKFENDLDMAARLILLARCDLENSIAQEVGS